MLFTQSFGVLLMCFAVFYMCFMVFATAVVAFNGFVVVFARFNMKEALVIPAFTAIDAAFMMQVAVITIYVLLFTMPVTAFTPSILRQALTVKKVCSGSNNVFLFCFFKNKPIFGLLAIFILHGKVDNQDVFIGLFEGETVKQ